jgi:transmembrane sensor
MNEERLNLLISKYSEGKCTPEETALLESWYLNWNENPRRNLTTAELMEAQEKLWKDLSTATLQVKPVRLWPRMLIAASVLLILTFGAYHYTHLDFKQRIVQQTVQDLPPGSNKATITLSDGKELALQGSSTGHLANQGNTSITFNKEGEIVYQNAKEATALLPLQYNTVTTPRGGQYPLILGDGTKVWLDASSSIRFPVAFTTSDRAVTITGQVYFEVAHDPARPFKVTAQDQVVEVLGTHFNINAYPDEAVVATTLFEGKVKVASKDKEVTLTPGQQANLNAAGLKVIKDADIQQAIAWHQGLFKFKNADIPAIMRQLARWYDVDVAYEGKIPDRKFSGEMYRNMSALKVSDILNYEQIHFRIEGRKIIVLP